MQRTGCVLLGFIIAATRKDNTVFLLSDRRHTAAGSETDFMHTVNSWFSPLRPQVTHSVRCCACVATLLCYLDERAYVGEANGWVAGGG
jgi:hypothetical protein